jgi:hypothetical protein
LENAVCGLAAKADGVLVNARKIMAECMDHIQTFIYPLKFSSYTGTAGVNPPLNANSLTYGPATSSVSAVPGSSYSATPTVNWFSKTTAVNYESMYQYIPNCLYQSQVKMLSDYTEGSTFAVAFDVGDVFNDNCIVKTFIKNGSRVPQREYPFDSSNMGNTDITTTFDKKYSMLIRRIDSMVIFVDKATGKPLKRIPSNIVMKLRKDGRQEADICNNAIGNFVGLMAAVPMKVVSIVTNEEQGNKVSVVDPSLPVVQAKINPAMANVPGNYFVGNVDVRALAAANVLQNEPLYRFLARCAFYRYRAENQGTFGGSNKMMITNMSNKTRNMNKRQRRSKSKSKSKSKSMSMFKSAKRAFYRTNKRNRTSKKY